MSAEPAPEITPEEVPGPLFAERPKRSADIVRSTHTSELVIALCGPIGTPLHLVADELQTCLRDRFGYDARTICLSQFIQQYGQNINDDSRFQRVKSLIREGDRLREEYGGSVLAECAVREISHARHERKKAAGTERHEPAKICHIVDSIKNQEELDIFRLVYRDMLHCIGVVSPLQYRVAEMDKQGMTHGQIYELIDQDSGEEFDHGQTVRNTFPQADFFLRVDNSITTAIRAKIERYLNIVLEAAIETPTPNETAMYLAASAATNSACLSRQVGAAITDKTGDILALGWNDVPKANGGLYTTAHTGTGSDMRCKNIGAAECQNDKMKTQLASDLTKSLAKAGYLRGDSEKEVESIILHSRVGDLIEFSRAIHAEMHAIITGAQKSGDRMIGGRLFCTTYPCHSCARHIIMSGIREVYYIEPYRKSLATKLHGDAISEDENAADKVRILPFDGVSPNRYLQLFSMGKDSRKKNGRQIRINPRDADLKIEISLESLPVLEAAVVKNLKEKQLQ
jgi:deoxycytidylate deaminase